MIQTSEDLRLMIRGLARHEPDPARVTHKILMAVTPEEAMAIVQVTLMEYVRRVMVIPVPVPTPNIPAPRQPESSETEVLYATGDGHRTPSAPTAAIRDWVAAELMRSVNVAENGREWKFQGDCTYDDCEAAENNRARKEGELRSEKLNWRAKKLAIAEHEVETLRQLPRPVLEELLKR